MRTAFPIHSRFPVMYYSGYGPDTFDKKCFIDSHYDYSVHSFHDMEAVVIPTDFDMDEESLASVRNKITYALAYSPKFINKESYDIIKEYQPRLIYRIPETPDCYLEKSISLLGTGNELHEAFTNMTILSRLSHDWHND